MDKKRCSNFSAMDINLLKDIVLSKGHIIENKKSDAITWRAKKNCWEDIAIEFNSRTLISRNADTLRKKWDNMKKNVKDKVAGQRKYALGTGGGPPMPPPNLTQEEEGIFCLIGVQAAGTESVCDSDQPNVPVVQPILINDDNNKENLDANEIIQDIFIEDTQEENLNKWSDYTPKTLRTKPSLKFEESTDKDNPFRRYRKRTYTGQLTNKAWTELANEKKEIYRLKKENLCALIAESEARKRYYDLQNQILEIELAKKKKESNSKD